MPAALTEIQRVTFRQPQGAARCWRVAITPDAARFAASSYFALEVYDRGEAAPRWSIPFLERDGIPQSLAWTPDGATLAVGQGSALHLYDGASGALQRALPLPAPANRLAWFPDGQRFALAHKDLYVCDAASGAVLTHAAGARSFAQLRVHPEAQRLVAVGEKSLWGFDLASGALLYRYPFARFGGVSLALDPGAERAWVVDVGPEALLLQLGGKRKKVLASFALPPSSASHEVVADPEGRWLLLTSSQGVSLHRFDDGAILAAIPLWDACRCDDLALDASGRFALSAHLDATARLWAIDPGDGL